jgi:hypothetical protein
MTETDHSEPTGPHEPSPDLVNLTIFDRLLHARRRRLPGGWCGLTYGGTFYRCFEGHTRFADAYLWERRYAGPDFCADANWARAAEDALLARGWHGPYLERLIARVYPRWQAVTAPADVLDFWFCLAHAAPADRARSMYEVLAAREAAARGDETEGDVDLAGAGPARAVGGRGGATPDGRGAGGKDAGGGAVGDHDEIRALVARAIELAEPLVGLTGDARDAAERPFLAFVGALALGQARAVLAVMYWGRGDHPSFAANLRAVSGSGDDSVVIARRMVAKAPLQTYLRDGLAKWDDWTRRP